MLPDVTLYENVPNVFHWNATECKSSLLVQTLRSKSVCYFKVVFILPRGCLCARSKIQSQFWGQQNHSNCLEFSNDTLLVAANKRDAPDSVVSEMCDNSSDALPEAPVASLATLRYAFLRSPDVNSGSSPLGIFSQLCTHEETIRAMRCGALLYLTVPIWKEADVFRLLIHD